MGKELPFNHRVHANIYYIIILLIITLLLLYVSSCTKPEPTPLPTPTPTPAPAPMPIPTPAPMPTPKTPKPALPKQAEASIELLVDNAELSINQYLYFRVWIETREKGISAGEINISFPIDVIEIVEIKSGELLGADPVVGAMNIDQNIGSIQYVLARKGTTVPPTDAGNFCLIKAKVLGTAVQGTYKISISKAGLADEAFEDIENFEVIDTTIQIGE